MLALVAGATTAGNFLSVGQYTLHITGMVSGRADHLVLGDSTVVRIAFASASFLLGAMTTAVLVNRDLRRRLHSAYALPLWLEAGALILFGLLGASLHVHTALLVPVTVLLLCSPMGLQNAVISNISRAEIRTTHVTGRVTDLGIELGKRVYVNRQPGLPPVRANRERMRMQGLLIGLFFAGGIVGALGFQFGSYAATVPLALWLLTISWRPVIADLGRAFRPG